MNRVMRLIAVVATASVVGCSAIRTEELAESDGPIQVAKLRAHGNTSYFRMQNVSHNPVQYYHWFGQGDEPVPYCRYENQEIRACSKVIYVDGDNYYVHERPIEPGKIVTFSAETKDAVALGVLLWLDGREQYVWHTLP